MCLIVASAVLYCTELSYHEPFLQPVHLKSGYCGCVVSTFFIVQVNWCREPLVEIVIFRRIHKMTNNNLPSFWYGLWSSVGESWTTCHVTLFSWISGYITPILQRGRERDKGMRKWNYLLRHSGSQYHTENWIYFSRFLFRVTCQLGPISSLVLVTLLRMTFRDDGDFYWKCLILSEKSEILTFL